MRYSDTHKSETHAKLVRLAGRALREKGPEKLAVAELMRAAGLTHGGFYAHFKSKDVLLTEALEGVFKESRRKFQRVTEGLPPREALARYIDFYVSPTHRDDLSRECPVVALNSDLPRQSRKFRATFDAGMQSLVRCLKDWTEAAGISDSEALAASVLSAMAGAVAVSRTVSDKRLSDELLKSTRESIKARLGLSDAAPSGGIVQ
ncbi:MAG: TetR/AcrR family transcriptional regulator [Steroidobacteraceae bacterium]|jgi:TetR/AcrR family transcriptional repressor of nem operon